MTQIATEGVFGHRCGQKSDLQWLGDPPVKQRIELLIADFGRWQVQRRPGAQGRPDFPGHGVETEARHAGGMTARTQIEGLTVPVDQIVQRAVFDHYALGLAGRTRGVDHVGEMGRIERVDVRVVLLLWPVCQVQFDQRGVQSLQAQPLQAFDKGRLSQHRYRRAVAQQIGNALVRVRRIDRHIARTGLEHRQQADQRLQAASCHHRHAVIGLYVKTDQMMSERIGARVQLAVAQVVCTYLCGNSIRLLLCQLLDALMNRQSAFVVGTSVIEVQQQSRTLAGGHDIKLIDRHLWRLLQRIDHAFHGPLHIGANTVRVDACGGLCRQAKGFTQIIDAQHQRIIAALLSLQHFNALPCFTGRLRRRAVPVVEQCVEQRRRRRYPTAALRQCQRCVFVAHQRGQALVGGAHCGLHALLVQIEAQRQGVDEDAQRPLCGFGTQQAPHQHGAEYHPRLSGEARQHPCPAQVEQAGDTDAQGSRLSAQALTQLLIEGDAVFFDCIALTAQILQTVGQRRFVEITQHLAEKRFMLSLADTQQRLPDIVAKRYRHAQHFGLSRQTGLDLMAHDLKSAMVHGNVVEQQRSLDPLACYGCMADQAHQRGLAQIHRQVCRERRAVDFQFSVAPDHLHRGFQPLPVY
ncbi:Uncharacterized protein ABJ98_2300 [Pseudomonas syringae pv. aceris]|nr:Uncharacterized protein ABJ98_2300 [Pseudomonas syringae pv. aceris]